MRFSTPQNTRSQIQAFTLYPKGTSKAKIQNPSSATCEKKTSKKYPLGALSRAWPEPPGPYPSPQMKEICQKQPSLLSAGSGLLFLLGSALAWAVVLQMISDLEAKIQSEGRDAQKVSEQDFCSSSPIDVTCAWQGLATVPRPAGRRQPAACRRPPPLAASHRQPVTMTGGVRSYLATPQVSEQGLAPP